MPKVKFTTVHEIEMDENNEQDIREIASQISKGALANVEDIVQGITVKSLKAEFVQEIDCLEVQAPII